MKWEKRKNVEPNIDPCVAAVLNNLDKYVENLANTSKQTDFVISTLLNHTTTLSLEQKAELEKQLRLLLKDEANFYKKMGIGGDRVDTINKIMRK